MSYISLKLAFGLSTDQKKDTESRIKALPGVSALTQLFPNHSDEQRRSFYVARVRDGANAADVANDILHFGNNVIEFAQPAPPRRLI